MSEASGFRLPGLVGRLSPIWLVLVAAILVAAMLSDRFLTPANILTVLHQGVVTGVVALGMTVVLIGGNFDLSAGAVVMMAAVLSLVLGPTEGWGTVVAIALPLACGALVGIVNGLAVCRAGANSIVATIAVQFMLFGAMLAAVSGQHVRTEAMSDVFWFLSNGRVFGLPFPVLLFAALVVALSVLMGNTVFGRHVYAIGGDVDASRRAGVPVVRRGITTFALSGTLAAFAGVLIASRVGHLDPTGIARYEFPALTAAVLGGTSLAGGIGRPADTAAAIIVVAVMTNVMTLLDFGYSSQLLAQGVILVLAVAYYAHRRGGS